MSTFLSLAPWQKIVDIVIVVSLIGCAAWIYLSLVHRAEVIKQLQGENAKLTTAAQDNANAATQAQRALARTTAALDAANRHAQANASEAGKLKERIANAPKDGCIGPAERALLDGLRTDALNRRYQVPEPIVTGDDLRTGAESTAK